MWALIGTSVVLLLYIISLVYRSNALSDAEIKYQQEKSFSKIINLFNKEDQSKIRLWDCQVASTHLPYVSLVYDNSINLWVHEIIQQNEMSLSKFIHLKNEMTGLTPGMLYNGNRLPQMDYDYLTADDSVYSSLYISYDGILVSTTVIGDSILHYELNSKNVALHENESSSNFVVFTARKLNAFAAGEAKAKMFVTLYKRGYSVFIFISYSGIKDPNKELVTHWLRY